MNESSPSLARPLGWSHFVEIIPAPNDALSLRGMNGFLELLQNDLPIPTESG